MPKFIGSLQKQTFPDFSFFAVTVINKARSDLLNISSKFHLRNGEDLGYSTDCQPGFFRTNRRGWASLFAFVFIL